MVRFDDIDVFHSVLKQRPRGVRRVWRKVDNFPYGVLQDHERVSLSRFSTSSGCNTRCRLLAANIPAAVLAVLLREPSPRVRPETPLTRLLGPKLGAEALPLDLDYRERTQCKSYGRPCVCNQ